MHPPHDLSLRQMLTDLQQKCACLSQIRRRKRLTQCFFKRLFGFMHVHHAERFKNIHEISASVWNHFICYISWGTAARTPSHSRPRQRIWVGLDAVSSVHRNLKNRPGKGNRKFPHRDHACDVYSRSRRTFGFVAFPTIHLDARSSHHPAYHRHCNGSYGTCVPIPASQRPWKKMKIEFL